MTLKVLESDPTCKNDPPWGMTMAELARSAVLRAKRVDFSTQIEHAPRSIIKIGHTGFLFMGSPSDSCKKKKNLV